MWRVIQEFRKKGLLDIRQGAPTRIAQPQREETEAVASESGCTWKRVSEAIRHDIIGGYWTPGAPLHSLKQLQQRYSVSYPTLRKALDSLCAEGVLIPKGRGFGVPQLRSSRFHSSILLVAPGDRSGKILAVTPRREEIYRSIEQECTRAHLELEKCLYIIEGGKIRYADGHGRPMNDITAGGRTIGCIYAVAGAGDYTVPLLERLGALSIPVAVLDNSGEHLLPRSLISHPLIRVFPLGLSTAPGHFLARHLTALGHRKIVYISPLHRSNFSRGRCDGLAEVYTRGGKGYRVVPITDSSFSVDWSLREKAAARLPDSRVERSIGMLKKSLPDSYIRMLDKESMRLRGVVRNSAEINERIAPLFERALGVRGCSAWVCVNDLCACMALEFLQARGIAVPDDISVVGFDDSVEALRAECASVNFNIPAIVRAMLDFLTGPRLLGTRCRSSTVTIDCMLIRRNSLGVVQGDN
jgi:hypothetical protein